jgi:hypothetical protein
MADDPKGTPVFQIDGNGNVTHLHGTALPAGLINTGASVVELTQQSAAQAERVVNGMYEFAERLNRK